MVAISVVMGVYNGGATLSATLESVLAQTEKDFELIVVDDGSADDTPQVLAEAAGGDSRVRVIRQDNAGLTRALIAGCAAAQGTYIARHDAGDLSAPERFAKQREVLDRNADVVFVSCATQFAGPELEPLYVARSTGVALQPAQILGHDGTLTDGPTHHGSVLFRRDAYERAGGYRAAFYYGQDFDLWYRLAQLGRFQAMDDVLYTARLTPGSISAAARGEQQALAQLSKEALLARLRGESDADVLARATAIVRPSAAANRAQGFYFIGEALRRNGNPRARRYLRDATREDPLFARAWLRWLQSLMLKA